MDVLDADLAGAHVAALGAKVLHTLERQLAQISVLDARGDQGHGDVPLDAVHARPRRNQGQDFGHQVHQGVGVVVFVLARLPQLVEPRPANHQRRIKLESVRAERRILKELLMHTHIPTQRNAPNRKRRAKANPPGKGKHDAKGSVCVCGDWEGRGGEGRRPHGGLPRTRRRVRAGEGKGRGGEELAP
jgi:hypothetical protein